VDCYRLYAIDYRELETEVHLPAASQCHSSHTGITAMTAVSLPTVLLAGCNWCCLAVSEQGGGAESTTAALSHSNSSKLTVTEWPRWGANWIQTAAAWHCYERKWSHTGCADRSPTRLGLANDSRKIGRSIGALVLLTSISSRQCSLATDRCPNKLTLNPRGFVF